MINDDSDQQRLDTAHVITKSIFTVVNDAKEKYGELYATELALTVLSSTIATIVYRSMSISDIDPYNYATIKHAMELTIASGFEAGLSSAGKPIDETDTVCRIYTMGKPLNNIPA